MYIHWLVYIRAMARSGIPTRERIISAANALFYNDGIRGVSVDAVVASARGTGNAGGVNADVPASWAPDRTRPLCAYPKVARYKGTGDIEKAESFVCQ